MSDRDLIDEALRAGRVRRIPTGERTSKERPPARHENQRPEPCRSGRQVHQLPGLSEIEGDQS